MNRTVNLSNCREAFVVDGSLRDLYVIPAGLEDWQNFLTFSANFTREFFVEGLPCAIPDQIGPVLDDTHRTYQMRLVVGGLRVQCYFFSVEEIELDVDPAEVATQERFDALTDFMRGLGKALGKNVDLTVESMPSHILLRYAFGSDAILCFC